MLLQGGCLHLRLQASPPLQSTQEAASQACASHIFEHVCCLMLQKSCAWGMDSGSTCLVHGHHPFPAISSTRTLSGNSPVPWLTHCYPHTLPIHAVHITTHLAPKAVGSTASSSSSSSLSGWFAGPAEAKPRPPWGPGPAPSPAPAGGSAAKLGRCAHVQEERADQFY